MMTVDIHGILTHFGSSQLVSRVLANVQLQAPSAKEVDGADKLSLQGYGRPYVDGKPGGKPSCKFDSVDVQNDVQVIYEFRMALAQLVSQVDATTPILVQQSRCPCWRQDPRAAQKSVASFRPSLAVQAKSTASIA